MIQRKGVQGHTQFLPAHLTGRVSGRVRAFREGEVRRDKYDILMSLLIRERANWICEWPTCGVYYPEGRRGGLEHSHIWGRRRLSTRWHPDNGVSLCTGHHRHVGANPIEHQAFALQLLGPERYAALELRHNTTRRWKAWEKDELYEQMKAALKGMQERRAMGHQGRLEFHLEAAEHFQTGRKVGA